MGKEIERKYLVNGEYKTLAIKKLNIIQAYISSDPVRTVRIRILGNTAFLTIKGSTNESGLSRFEWEKEIEVTEAKELLHLCEPGVINKTRHYIPFEDILIEVDEFHHENAGLVLAEIELNHESQNFNKPHWLGKEVTGDKRYYNSYLSKKPFTSW